MQIKQIILILFIISFCTNSFANNIEEARFELEKKNFTKAEELLKKELKENPNSLELHQMLEKIYFESFQMDKMLQERNTIKDLKKALPKEIPSKENTSIEILDNNIEENNKENNKEDINEVMIKDKTETTSYNNFEKPKLLKLKSKVKLVITKDSIHPYKNLDIAFTDYLSVYFLLANFDIIEIKRVNALLEIFEKSADKQKPTKVFTLNNSDYLLSYDIEEINQYTHKINKTSKAIKESYFKVVLKLINIKTGKLVLSEVLNEKVIIMLKDKSKIQEYELEDKIIQKLAVIVSNKCVNKLNSLI